MKKILSAISLALALMCASSCSFLEREPDFMTPDYYYENEEEMTNALYGVYNRLIDTNGRMYSKGLFGFFVLSDEFSYTNSFLVDNIRHGTFDAADLDIGRLWEILYEGVSRANFLIASFDGKDIEAQTANVKAILGEALFMRGYYYFLLTTCFGEVPLKLTPTTSPDEPYLEQSSLETIYGQIVKDMTEAEKLVLDIDVLGSNERISRTGVQAVLARVYLKMAGAPLNDPDNPDEDAMDYYKQALFYANEVVSSGKHSLNTTDGNGYRQIFLNQVQNINESKEVIWEVGMYGNKIGAEDLAGSVGVENGILCRDESLGYSGGPMTAQKKLFDAFGGKDDLRRDWAIADFQVSYDSDTDISTPVDLSDESKEVNIWKRNPGKWRRVDWDRDAGRFVTYEPGTLAQLYTGTNFPLMRYADVLLMKAEAINESLKEPNSEAYDAVNQVRRRAYGFDVYTPNPVCDLPENLSREDFRQAVRDERFRELCFEGQRKWDLIRWGVYVDTMHELADDVMATAPQAVYQYCARAGQNTTERNVLFPIPNTELTVNKKIEQNPGW